MDEVWSFEHSLDCPVSREFAWQFWTHVSNWKLDSDIESVELNGPFADGVRGTTLTKSSGRIEWRITHVQPGTGAVIAIALPGGTGLFHWKFEGLDDGTRITQRVSVSGEQAALLVETMAQGLETGIPAGMQKLCDTMARAAAEAS